MKTITLTCDICEESIGVIPNEDEEICSGDGLIVYSNYPSYVKIRIDGHGLLAQEKRDVHICKNCYNDIICFLHINKEEK